MASIYTTLKKENDSNTSIYPNIIPSQNIPNASITESKLSASTTYKINNPLSQISDGAITSSKLSTTLVDAINNAISFSAFNTSFLDVLVIALATYGLTLTYTYVGGVYTISITNTALSFDVSSYHDITIHNSVFRKNDDHIMGMLVLEINEQITANDNLYLLDNQTERPLVDTPLIAFKNGAMVVANVDEDGYISVNAGLDEHDSLIIRLDWWC